jgi:hypothetical protein
VSPSNRIAWAAPFEIVRMFCQHQCKTVVLKQGWPDYEFKSRQNLTFFLPKTMENPVRIGFSDSTKIGKMD